MSKHKIKKISIIKKEDLLNKENNNGIKPRKVKKIREFTPMDVDDYRNTAKLRERLNKKTPAEKK